jgi:transposase
MNLSSEKVQDLPELPFSAEDWAATPKPVQEFVKSLIQRIPQLEAELAELRERVNRNSRNSSQPPSQDGPQVERNLVKSSPGGRRRGGQPGHSGWNRKLVPVEEVQEVQEIKPSICERCARELVGEDPEP